jgi:hypothetical protein
MAIDPTPAPATLPADFWAKALALAIVAGVLALVDNYDRRAGLLLLAALLLGIAVYNRAGVVSFAGWFRNAVKNTYGG